MPSQHSKRACTLSCTIELPSYPAAASPPTAAHPAQSTCRLLMWLPLGPSRAPTRRSGISMMRKHTLVRSRMPAEGHRWAAIRGGQKVLCKAPVQGRERVHAKPDGSDARMPRASSLPTHPHQQR